MCLIFKKKGKAKDEECHISNSNADSDTEPGDELKVTDPVEAANEIFEHSMETAKSNYTIEMGSKLTAEMKAAFLMIGKSMHSLGLQTGGTEENDINKS